MLEEPTLAQSQASAVLVPVDRFMTSMDASRNRLYSSIMEVEVEDEEEEVGIGIVIGLELGQHTTAQEDWQLAAGSWLAR